ncbi:MAG: ferredoxin [Pseudomonadota bacterium]
MKVIVDRETCIGCGICPDVCPEVFEMGDDVAIVKVDEIPDGMEEAVKDAASQCPVEAISVEE